MKEKFQIGEIAKFFDLPSSTLRYWQECGIIAPDKNKKNQYRTYTVSDLMTISDIIFYKSLGISLKDIRDIDKNTPIDQKIIFEKKMDDLLIQQQQLIQRMNKLQHHIEAINTLEALKNTPYQETDIDTECIVSFDLIEQKKLLQYIENPYLYSRVQHSSTLFQEKRGLTIPLNLADKFAKTQVIWRKKSNKYITFLMREEVSVDFPNDLKEHLKHIQSIYRTGDIISRFLLCAQEDGKTYDFYKTYVEILPQIGDSDR